ncbi:MAG: alkaline phosphatase family protein [Planctomycetes bacterium]|nr:alkaline phosphatase family protein [Planctomycetota bacterium]MBI3848104.1 alkaline phosphatase family protein [Planctomycetota bacterium]
MQGAGAAAGWFALGGLGYNRAFAQPTGLPPPEASNIDHIVLVTMENRSFDHFLGWLPGAEGRQRNLTFFDAAGTPHTTQRLFDFQGCSHPDPDHSYGGGRIEYNNGACDGWLRAGSNDDYAIGYYRPREVLFFANAAARWTTCDHYFAPIMAETFPNRIYQHAAQTDRLHNTFEASSLPTIWDRLAAAGLNGRYYYSDVPALAIWGTRYLPIAHSFQSFLDDAASGSLPHVSYVDPRFIDAPSGTSGDDHPHADIRNGDAFLNQIYRAVINGPDWPRTLLVITFDEWGGFFDHVPPPPAVIPSADQAAGNVDGLRGFRVPTLLISIYGHRRISHVLFDHTSVLRMIEWRWNLQPLTVRDATANNLAEALDFTTPLYAASRFDIPAGPFGTICHGFAPASDKWQTLRQMAADYGWPIG